MSVLVATNGEQYLLDNGDGTGQVYDIETGSFTKPKSLDSFLSRGYWTKASVVPKQLVDREMSKGEGAGHDFHGNQHTGSLGSEEKPTSERTFSSARVDGPYHGPDGNKMATLFREGLPSPGHAETAKAQVAQDIANRMGSKYDEQLFMERYRNQTGEDCFKSGTVWNPGYQTIGPDGELRPAGYNSANEPNSAIGPSLTWPSDQLAQSLREEGVGRLVAQWAGSSNDTEALSLAMQESAAETFGLSDHVSWPTDPATAGDVSDLMSKNGEMYGAFLQSQYDSTQEYLASHGISEVQLARGYDWGAGIIAPEYDTGIRSLSDIPEWAQGSKDASLSVVNDIGLRPLSSFTTNINMANSFAGESGYIAATLVTAIIPADRILSCPRTGLGCLKESEMVVLAGSGTYNVRTGETAPVDVEYDSEGNPLGVME